jgi:starch synthase (maltosyl-transferring)
MATRTQLRTPPRATAVTVQFAPIVIERVTPELDCGRHAVKRLVGDACAVGASIFKDGHDLLAARVRYRGPSDDGWRYAPLAYDFNADRWSGAFPVDEIGRWTYTVEAWTDRFGTWYRDLEKKRNAGQDVSVELLEGAELIDAAARRTKFGAARSTLARAATALRAAEASAADRVETALTPELIELMQAHGVPTDLTAYGRELAITVERRRAGFASWYEFFPRSQGSTPGKHGTFADAERRLPRLAELGFDVIYLPPIHPIGHTFRKGRNNSLQPAPGDVGSPWAIGNEHGGHTAIEPQLGTIEDFDRFVSRANELGMEIALDYALQCSPDHPWVKEHPEWFIIRPDGTIQYAENPPKKYQDIYPLNFWSSDREGLWNACRDIFLYWIEHGVKTFRVDNPHTKPFAFWEWCLAEVRRRHPDVVFLSEAFTRPSKLLNLAKLGFSQSYTYFTWKNTAAELREFMTDFSRPEVLEYYRGNLFANTPDILHEFLQHGGRPAFRLRLLLAGTLSPLYGIYSGYELSENVPVRPGSEEYLDSEKYEIRVRNYEAPGNLNGDIALLNRIRREQTALQRADNLTFVPSENAAILCFRKAGGVASAAAASGGRDADLIVAVNLDPHHAHATMVHVPVEVMGIGRDEPYTVHDLLTGARYTWRGSRNFVLLDPAQQPGHVLRVER